MRVVLTLEDIAVLVFLALFILFWIVMGVMYIYANIRDKVKSKLKKRDSERNRNE